MSGLRHWWPITGRWLFFLCLMLGFLAGYQIVRAAVTLMDFEAEVQQDGILLKWETGSEINNVGFYLYRATDPASRGEMLIFIESTLEVTGDYYEYLDEEVIPGTTYYYTLGALDTNGNVEYSDPVTATFPLPVTPTPTVIPSPTPTATASPTASPNTTDTPGSTATATSAASQPSTPTRTPTRAPLSTSTPTPTWTAVPGVTNTPGATNTPSPTPTFLFTPPPASPTAQPIPETPTPPLPATAAPPAAAPEPPSLPTGASTEDLTERLNALQPPVALAAAPPPARQLPPTATPSPRSLLPKPADAMLYLATGSLCGALVMAVVALTLWRGLR